MNGHKAIQLNPQLTSLLSSYWQWRKLWILTTVAFCVLGFAYAVVLKRDTWVASQALIVRDEATGAVMRLGRFESQTQMKASQETVLEMARNSQVVEAALKTVGRPARFFGLLKNDAPPTRSEIEQLANNAVAVRAPRGAELGTTEVIYLDVKQNSRERAVQLTLALCDALENQLKSVRVELAGGVIQELEAARSVCQTSLQQATDELQKMEVEAGSDLADLRGLSDSSVGSTYRLMLDNVRDELRKADLSIRTMTPSFQLAKAALEDSSLVLQAADFLKDAHPAIERLREGLSEARVKTANLEGRFTVNHPDVLNARQVEAALQRSIHEELALVVHGYQASIAIAQQKIDALNQQELELGKRLNRLADIRGKYSNLVSEVKARSDSLSQIKKELTQTIASRDAAQVASLLTRLDTPVLGEKPVGPGRTTIIGGATVGGLMFGLGVVFLLVPLDGRVSSADTRPENSLSTGRSQSADSKPSESTRASSSSRYSVPSDGRSSQQAGTQAFENATQIAQASRSQANAKPLPTDTPLTQKASMSESTETSAVAQPNLSETATTSITTNPAAKSDTPTQNVVERPKPTSATAAAKSLEAQKPRRSESIDDVRDLISNALKCHVQNENG